MSFITRALEVVRNIPKGNFELRRGGYLGGFPGAARAVVVPHEKEF